MSEVSGGRVDPPDPPIDPNEYEISVKVPDQVVTDGSIRTYLHQIAHQINESDHVHIWPDESDGLRRDETGAYWADATMTIEYNIGSCPGRRPEDLEVIEDPTVDPGESDDDEG